MLEHVPVARFEGRTFRYTVEHQEHQQVLHDLNYGPEEVREMLDLLRERGVLGSSEQYLDAPFRVRPNGEYPAGRFSDGSYPVFYSALEVATAEAEAIDAQVRFAIGRSTRLAHFVRVSCQFAGQVKDLRPHLPAMPFLIAPQNAECHGIGAEAFREGLGGLLTPSAQRQEGTCLPVFQRSALSEPREEQMVVFLWNPDTNSIELRL